MKSTIVFGHEFPLPQARVFAALDDHANMGRWLGPRVSIIQQGKDGIGTIRRVHAPPFPIDEEIIERAAPSFFAYRIVRGVPFVRGHRGEVHVEPLAPTRARVRWHIEIDSPLPGYGAIVLRLVRFVLISGLKRLERQLMREPFVN